MTYANMFGMDFEVNFPTHSVYRARERDVNKYLIIEAMEFADEVIGDNINNNNPFVLVDKRLNQSFIAKFKSITDGPPAINIITVWHGVDIKIAEGQKVVEIEKDNSINFYIFHKEAKNNLNNRLELEDDLEL